MKNFPILASFSPQLPRFATPPFPRPTAVFLALVLVSVTHAQTPTHVSGSDPTWTTTSIRIGGDDADTDTLLIDTGGRVESTNDYSILGSSAGSLGTVTVTHAGSTWTNASSLFVGNFGAGVLTISDGGEVSNLNGFLSGHGADSSGTATVTGTNSKWTSTQALTIGLAGTGDLTISAGGTVFSNSTAVVLNVSSVLGEYAGSQGTATVTGPASAWHEHGMIRVGVEGTGSLTIENQGLVDSNRVRIGDNADSHGTVTVTGAGSAFNQTDDLHVGYNGTGTLTLSNGGNATHVEGHIGTGAGMGSVTVTGNDSTLASTSFLSVGDGSTGSLLVENGGLVTNGETDIGYFAGSSGTVTVGGGGTLTVDGGNGLILVANAIGSTGTLRIGSGGSSTAGTVNADTVRLRRATGSLVFDHVASTTFTPNIIGAGTLVKQNSGTTILAGANTYSGGTTIYDGTLQLGADHALGSGNLTLLGGTLALDGFDQTLGTLTLGADAAFDFGSGASTLSFADSSALLWSGTLTLFNYTIGSDTLSFGSGTGLTLDQLSLISLTGYIATGLDAAGNVQFTTSAIPEPSTYAVLLGLAVLGFTAWCRRSKSTGWPQPAASA